MWNEIEATLEKEPTVTAKELLLALQKQYPDQFGDGQLRTLQRRVWEWRTARAGSLHEPPQLDTTLAAQTVIVAPLLSRVATASSLDNNSDNDLQDSNEGVVKKVLSHSTDEPSIVNSVNPK